MGKEVGESYWVKGVEIVRASCVKSVCTLLCAVTECNFFLAFFRFCESHRAPDNARYSINIDWRKEKDRDSERKIERKKERKRTDKSRRETRNANDRSRALYVHLCTVTCLDNIDICIKPMYKRKKNSDIV